MEKQHSPLPDQLSPYEAAMAINDYVSTMEEAIHRFNCYDQLVEALEVLVAGTECQCYMHDGEEIADKCPHCLGHSALESAKGVQL